MIVLDDVSTWPSDVICYLEKNHELFLNSEQNTNSPPRSEAEDIRIGPNLDNAIYGLRDVLNSYQIHGYHCTRLLNHEIDHIKLNGMQPPNLQMLKERIQTAMNKEHFSREIARILEGRNQADDSNRAGMICFLFSKPPIGGERGLYRLFRSWGGEALYNSHEDDPTTGPILQRMGTPCIVEAKVPIRDLAKHGGLDSKIVRQFLVNRGFESHDPLEHEDRAICHISPENIMRIMIFPEPDFITLTRCNTWSVRVA